MNQQVNSFDFLHKKIESPNVRVQKAIELLEKEQLSVDTIMRWLSKSFSNDQGFRSSAAAWSLLKRILLDGNFKTDRFTIYIKPIDLLPAYQSDFHKEAFETIEILVTKYTNAWRPDYLKLMEFISEMLKTNIRKDEVSIMMRILLNKPEVTASIKLLFDNAKTLLLKPILQHINELDQDLSFTLLASLLCVPYFVRKASDDTGKTTREIVEALNEYPKSSSLFVPYLIRSFVKQMNLLNIPMSLNFPLELIEGSKSLDIAAPLIKECRELKMYKVMNESKDLARLQKVGIRSVKEGRSDVLVELSLIDFNTVRPILKSILSSKELTTSELSVSILKQIFNLKNPMILFEIGDLPSHLLSLSEFIQNYCEGVKYLISNQLLMVLNHLIGYSNRIEESCLLYWSIKSGRLTSEFDEIIDRLLLDCFANPWRFAAAVLAAKKLQKKLPPPRDNVKDATTHPVILDCFLCENYGTIEFKNDRILSENDQVPPIPSPYMNEDEAFVYRSAFIIRNLPSVAASIDPNRLVEIIAFVVSKSVFAASLDRPKTIADYCLNALHNAAFYECEEIQAAFAAAVLPLLPNHHLSAHKPRSIQIEQLCLSAIVASMPPEFVSQKVATAAFVGLFVSFEGLNVMALTSDMKNALKMGDVFENFRKEETFVKCIVNASENVSKTFVRHNFTRIFDGSTDDSVVKTVPILLQRLLLSEDGCIEGEICIPKVNIARPSQLISICDFCAENKIRLPFDETLFAEDLDSFCAQLRAAQPSAISILLEQDKFTPEQAVKIVSSLIWLDDDSSSKFTPDFLRRLIDALVQNNENSIDKRSVTTFCGRLANDLILYFLEVSPLFYYPLVFTSLNIRKEEFQNVEKYVLRFLSEEKPSLADLKLLSSIRLSHSYNGKIVNLLYLTIIGETNRLSFSMDNSSKDRLLNEVCLLIQSTAHIINNCSKEAAKEVTSSVEVVRKLSSLFARAITCESPSYKELKTFSKMFAAAAKVAFSEELQYLIASFVSHLTLYQPKEREEQKMRSLQTAVFPLFDRCSREQMNEISASLHDSHREVFRQITERWTKEAQYKGKV